MRPERYACRPAMTACFMASAISTGSCALAMPVFIRTASAPSSMAMAASEAVPTPASTMSGTPLIISRRMRMCATFWMPMPLPMGAPSGMIGRCAGIDQALGENDVVGGIGKHGEPFLHQYARGFQRGLHVGIERGLVADDFELDPIGESDFAAEASGADGFVGGVASGSVGQQEVFLGIDVVEQRFLAAVEIHAAYGDRDHLGAAGFEGARGFLERFVFSRANDQPRAERTSGDDQ